jgi:predicted nuclease with TOPRIM domain
MQTLLATIEAWIKSLSNSSKELARALAKLEELEDQLTRLDDRVEELEDQLTRLDDRVEELEDGPGLTRAIEDVIRNNVTVNIDVI